MSKEANDISVKMNLERTDEIFNSLISRSNINDKSAKFDEDAIKAAKAVLASGNLHVKTAAVKLGAIKLAGYYTNMERLKTAIEKRARNARRPR